MPLDPNKRGSAPSKPPPPSASSVPLLPLLAAAVALVAAGVAYLSLSRPGPSPSATFEHPRSTFRRYALPERGWSQARDEIVTAIQDSYRAYADSDAWGCDDFYPEQGTGGNLTAGGSIGYFIVDVLDTLLLTPGMEKEYARAKEYVRNDLTFDVDGKFNAFETTIRVLGGLLAAYHLDGHDPLYLSRAVELGERLLPIFNTPTGVPLSFINLKTGEAMADADNNGYSSLAEATTLQLEFKYLAEISGRPEFWEVAERAMMAIRSSPSLDGLLPILVSPQNLHFFFHIRLGSRGDSYYEMLIKQYLQTSRLESVYRDMYDRAMHGVKQHLVQETPRGMVYTGELHPRQSDQPGGGPAWGFAPKQDHLVCFLGGSFILGVTEGRPPSLSPDDITSLDDLKSENWQVGTELVRTCVDTYQKTATGLAPEIVDFSPPYSAAREWKIPGYSKERPPLDARNILRPETVESLLLAWRATHDETYREWGWEIFKAFEEHCRLPSTGAYTSIVDVETVPPTRENKMETFWLSETLKYLLLLFSDDDVVPLDRYVFNTEAHILPIFEPTVVDVSSRRYGYP